MKLFLAAAAIGAALLVLSPGPGKSADGDKLAGGDSEHSDSGTTGAEVEPAAERLDESRFFQFRWAAQGLFKIQPAPGAWIEAWPEDGSESVLFGRKVVAQFVPETDSRSVAARHGLGEGARVAPEIYIFETESAWASVHAAAALGREASVVQAYPVVRRPAELSGAYARRPNDQYFDGQWYLENRHEDGAIRGVDINVRGAWPLAQGEGVIVAVADAGVQLDHPDLIEAAGTPWHFSFMDGTTNGGPLTMTGEFGAHGTAVAGLILAKANDQIGMAGVAPGASLASWIIFGTDRKLVSDEQLMEMYQYASNGVAVQNHSWGMPGPMQQRPTLLEEVGISNAVTRGRDGLGVVMVRSAGNNRARGGDANDDGYITNPNVIAVGAVQSTGRVTASSEPGANVLVGAPSSDAFGNGLFTADLTGANGVNSISFFPPNQSLSDYRFNALGFKGTSAAAPLVSGIVALMLSANPALGIRDVQQILILASRHFDLDDPHLKETAAGFRVSSNTGYGVPDAAQAVKLAWRWENRPPAVRVEYSSAEPRAIPDLGLRVLAQGADLPENIRDQPAMPGFGLHPALEEPWRSAVDIGLALEPVEEDLTGKVALIERGVTDFAEKIAVAADAGAALAIIINSSMSSPDCPGGDNLCAVGGTDFSPIPALFVAQTDGTALREYVRTNALALVSVRQDAVHVDFEVSDTLLLEHVSVRIRTDHTLRGDLRITLTSPGGVASVLQQLGPDTSSGPVDWIYTSVHHFFESSAGAWRLTFLDEFDENTGNVLEATLILNGVEIKDSDRDGLDDDWELRWFGSLEAEPGHDFDGDGFSNMYEQIAGTDPTEAEAPFVADLAEWNEEIVRLSWPGRPGRNYQVWAGEDPAGLVVVTNLPALHPETEWFTPSTNSPWRFFRITSDR